MAIIKGFLGGLIKAGAAGFLLSGGLLLGEFRELLESYRAEVEAIADPQQLIGVLQEFALQARDLALQLAEPLAAVVIAWLLGGALLSRAWGDLSRNWPLAARVGLGIVSVLFFLAALVGALVPARFFLAGFLDQFKGLLDILGMPWLVELAPLLLILPMGLPVVKGLFAFVYSTGRGRLGAALLVAGGILYLAAAYQVYTAYKLGNVIVAHVQSILLQGLQAEAVLREASLTLADMVELMLNRLEGLLVAITAASLLYALGFLLYKYEPKPRPALEEAKDKAESRHRSPVEGPGHGGRVHILQDSLGGAALLQGLRGR